MSMRSFALRTGKTRKMQASYALERLARIARAATALASGSPLSGNAQRDPFEQATPVPAVKGGRMMPVALQAGTRSSPRRGDTRGRFERNSCVRPPARVPQQGRARGSRSLLFVHRATSVQEAELSHAIRPRGSTQAVIDVPVAVKTWHREAPQPGNPPRLKERRRAR